MSYREELIQIAAVAVAMIEDLDCGQSDSTNPDPRGGFAQSGIFNEVLSERFAQDKKWGPQHHDPPMWLTILMEEVGEAAQAFLEETE